MIKFAMPGDITAENIFNFYEEFAEGKLSPFVKSEDVPEDNNGPVYTVVGKNFEDLVMDDTKDVLIKFYAPWCGHCKSVGGVILC